MTIDKIQNHRPTASMYLDMALGQLTESIQLNENNFDSFEKDSISVAENKSLIFPKIRISELFYNYLEDNYRVEDIKIENIGEDLKDLNAELQVFYIFALCKWFVNFMDSRIKEKSKEEDDLIFSMDW